MAWISSRICRLMLVRLDEKAISPGVILEETATEMNDPTVIFAWAMAL